MRKEFVDDVVARSHKYNFDKLIETIVSWDPIDIRKRLTKAYIFASNRAMHTDDLRAEDVDAIEVLQQLIEAMDDIEHPNDALLVVRVK